MTFEEWWDLFEGDDSTKEIAATAWNAAILAAAKKCNDSDGWDVIPKDYARLVLSCRVELPIKQ